MKIKMVKYNLVADVSSYQPDTLAFFKELKAKGIVTKIELQVPFILQDKYIIFNNKVIYLNKKTAELI